MPRRNRNIKRNQQPKTKQPTTPRKVTASGSAIGKRAKKMVGCEACNFGTPYFAKDKAKYKRGTPCPRCASKNTLRVFDSSAEWVYHNELRLLQNLGEITDLQYQVRYDLHCPSANPPYSKKVTSYIADFTYVDLREENEDKQFKVVDVKGGNAYTVVVSPEAKLKMKWFELEYGIPVTIVGR